jgi:hypothetical protein
MLHTPFVDHGRIGRIELVIAHDHLGDRLVHRQERALRTGARITLSDEVQVRGEMHLHRVVACIRLDEVEEQIRVIAADGGQCLRTSVDGERGRFVSQFA